MELLIADIRERPGSVARTLDVARGGIVARLTGAGFCGFPPAGASLGAFGVCVTVFAGFGAAMWSQLLVGWQWARPGTASTAAVVVMTAALLVLAVLAVLAAVPVIGAARGQRSWRLARPATVAVAGLAVLVVGTRHFENGWPGTGGHAWAHVVPGGVAAFAWAATLFVTSYWAHPAALASFPAPEVAWMAVSPVALVCVAGGAVVLVRRLELSPRVLRFEARLGAAAWLTMAGFLAGGALWLGGGHPAAPFRPGAIDIAGLVAMTATLALARRPARQVRT